MNSTISTNVSNREFKATSASTPLCITSPGGREGPLLTQDAIVDAALARLERFPCNFSPDQSARVVNVIRWAVAYEAEINNTIIRNSGPEEMRAAISDRFRPEYFGVDGADIIHLLLEETNPERRPRANSRQGYVKSPEDLLAEACNRLNRSNLGFFPLQIAAIERVIEWAIAAETEANNLLIQNATGPEIRNALETRVRPKIVTTLADGSRQLQNLHTPFWSEWYPGLDTDDRALREVLSSLPGFPASKVPEIVRRYENPESPAALPGAVSLERHDVIHVLVGRGLLDQDEAFVIGFTMGTAKEDLTDAHVEEMKHVFSTLYPEPYRIAEEDLIAFELGVKAGREIGIKDLFKLPLEEYGDYTIAEIRGMLGIDKERLREIFREEARLIPNTLETERLAI